MLKTTNVTQFLFREAQYYLSNAQGADLLLKIDYEHRQFQIENLHQENRELTQEAQQIATDLLARKHNVNFAQHASMLE